MKPLKLSLFVIFLCVMSFLLGASLLDCWNIWRVRQTEKTVRLENFKAARLFPIPSVSGWPPENAPSSPS